MPTAAGIEFAMLAAQVALTVAAWGTSRRREEVAARLATAAAVVAGVQMVACFLALSHVRATDGLPWARLMAGDALPFFAARSAAILGALAMSVAAVSLAGAVRPALLAGLGLLAVLAVALQHPKPAWVPLPVWADKAAWVFGLGAAAVASALIARRRSARSRGPRWKSLLAGAALASVAALGLDLAAWGVATSPLAPPVGPDPVAAARALRDAGCGACHRIAGRGHGTPGGPLEVAGFRGEAPLAAFLAQPTRQAAERLGLRTHATGEMSGIRLAPGDVAWMAKALVALAGGSDRATAPEGAPLRARATGGRGCLSCHEGIEPVMPEDSGMMRALRALGGEHGDCVVCHGGDPTATTPEAAHRGSPDGLAVDRFYPAPGSIWIADRTCGTCHAEHVERMQRALMSTEAGKAQGTMHTLGFQSDRVHRYGNYPVERLPDHRLSGSPAYQAYMAALEARHPGQFPARLAQIPTATADEVAREPSRAALTYLRQECQACHIGVRGPGIRGDWRALGCAACHMPATTDGFSQSGDPTIPKDEPGHVADHRIRGTAETGGIPVATCVACHNRGKRIGVNEQGLMESAYDTPFGPLGEPQPPLHGKHYLYLQADVHHLPDNGPENPEGSMLCGDCHTSVDVHGDGRVFGTTLAQVEIECSDCHGTTRAYPWELPLGYMDEFAPGAHEAGPAGGAARGVATEPDDAMLMSGRVVPVEQGYLLTARGNPFGNVVRRGEREAVLHSATGAVLKVPLLKDLLEQGRLSEAGRTAMHAVSRHLERMECYTCHSTWAPQCYGCHLTFDYRKGAEAPDWIATGDAHRLDGTVPSYRDRGAPMPVAPGKSVESRGYLRWEDPVLGVNGEGRVTPIYPGCQPVVTIVGPSGESVVHNHVWTVEGVPGIDMSPSQPHTVDPRARRCESCHTNPKAVGYGIEDGRFLQGYDRDRVVDVDVDGKDPARASVQFFAVPGQPRDWSQVVSRDGRQLQTVGSHWPLERPLDAGERAVVEKAGLCIGCHALMGSDAWSRATEPGRFDAEGHARHLREMLP